MLKDINLKITITSGLLIAFLANTFGIFSVAQAQEFMLPKPGVMVPLSPAFNPPVLKGLKVHPNNPFRFDFILDKGDSRLGNDQLKTESTRLIKYFLASLTIPEKDLWVNLSPYEKDRIIPQSFGLTEMGRDLLAEDYMLKQITASLIYPEGETGKRFWRRVYVEAAKRFGTTNIQVNTFNKVWIVPEKAVVFENAKAKTAYVVESRLKVMLEQDYLSLEKHEGIQSIASVTKNTNQIGSQIVREIVIPELTKEVNQDKNFSQLRQVYHSLILATWYKKKIKDSILAAVYENRNKVAGVNNDDPKEKERIYERYLEAFKKGSYNYIKEEIDPLTQQSVPRKYFSGGLTMDQQAMDKAMIIKDIFRPSMLKKSPISSGMMLIGASMFIASQVNSIQYPNLAGVGGALGVVLYFVSYCMVFVVPKINPYHIMTSKQARYSSTGARELTEADFYLITYGRINFSEALKNRNFEQAGQIVRALNTLIMDNPYVGTSDLKEEINSMYGELWDAEHSDSRAGTDYNGYYATIGVERHASPEVITGTYRRKARRVHPDVPGTGSAPEFLKLKEAYDVLNDPEKRKMYDQGKWPKKEDQAQTIDAAMNVDKKAIAATEATSGKTALFEKFLEDLREQLAGSYLTMPLRDGRNLTLQLQLNSGGWFFAVDVYPFDIKNETEIRIGRGQFSALEPVFNIEPSNHFLASRKTIGKILFMVRVDAQGNPIILFEENQPSLGFRMIPLKQQELFFNWIEVVQQRIMNIAYQLGAVNFYAHTAEYIKESYPSISEVNLDLNYRRVNSVKKGWKKTELDIFNNGKKQEVWRYTGFDTAMNSLLNDALRALKAQQNDQFKTKIVAFMEQLIVEQKEHGISHWQVVEPFKDLIEYVENPSTPVAQLRFLEEISQQLRPYQADLRIAAPLGILVSSIKRYRTKEWGGMNDLNALTNLNALLDNQLLSAYQRKIVSDARAGLADGSWHPGINPLSQMLDEYRRMILLEDGLDFPPRTRRDIYLPISAQMREFLSGQLNQDMPGSVFLTDQSGRTLLYQFHPIAAVSQPYIGMIIHKSGIPLRMAIKDKTFKQRDYDHVSHLGGTKLLSILNCPVAWVFEGARYVYIREIRDREITDYINEDFPTASPEIHKRFFFALGVAMSEAYILGMSDRRRNLIVSLRRLAEFDTNSLSEAGSRAIFNIDRENVLTPKQISRPPMEDIDEAASMPNGWRRWVPPIERPIFDDNLSYYLDGFKQGFRSIQAYFRVQQNVIKEKIMGIAQSEGSPYGANIIERLKLSDPNIDALADKIKAKAEALFKLPDSPDSDDEAMTVTELLSLDPVKADIQLHLFSSHNLWALRNKWLEEYEQTQSTDTLRASRVLFAYIFKSALGAEQSKKLSKLVDLLESANDPEIELRNGAVSLSELKGWQEDLEPLFSKLYKYGVREMSYTVELTVDYIKNEINRREPSHDEPQLERLKQLAMAGPIDREKLKRYLVANVSYSELDMWSYFLSQGRSGLRPQKIGFDEYRQRMRDAYEVVVQALSRVLYNHYMEFEPVNDDEGKKRLETKANENLIHKGYDLVSSSEIKSDAAMNAEITQLLQEMREGARGDAIMAFTRLKQLDPRYNNMIPVDMLFRVMLEEQKENKNVNVVMDFPRENVFVERRKTGRGTFESSVINELIINAFKYTPEHGTITVKLRQEGGRVLFSVKDTGIGIPDADKEKVWRDLYRAPNAIAVHRGTGTGLYSMRLVIQRDYDGTISFESKEGEGTTFTGNIAKGNVPDPAMIPNGRDVNRRLVRESFTPAKGGIDLTSDQALTVQNNGQAIKFHVDPAQLKELQNAPGFVPVIIDFQPMTDIRFWLGLDDHQPAGHPITSI